MEDGSIVVPVALSRRELARIVGATVETVIRTMSRWGREGIVETTSSGFVVRDPAALRAVISSTSPGEP